MCVNDKLVHVLDAATRDNSVIVIQVVRQKKQEAKPSKPSPGPNPTWRKMNTYPRSQPNQHSQ